jgi:hypothetical protein
MTSLFDPAEPPVQPELPHWLVVDGWRDYDCSELAGDLFDIEHHLECPSKWHVDPEFPDITYGIHDCIFQQMVDDVGIESYFQHRDDPGKDNPYTERVAPGRWPIETWFETYHCHEGNEYDAGLRLVDGVGGNCRD